MTNCLNYVKKEIGIIHTLPDLHSSYTLESLVQFIFCTRQNSVHIMTNVHENTWKYS